MRSITELLNSNDSLKGGESQRLRTYFTGNALDPDTDLDGYGRMVLIGDLDGLKRDFANSVSRLCSTNDFPKKAQAVASREIYERHWGPTRVPVFNLILLCTIIVPPLREKYLEIARWLISEAEVPVDAVDLSGSQAIYHAISTKPSFDHEYAQILCDAGADVNYRNRYGGTPAHEMALIWDYQNEAPSKLAAAALSWFLSHGGNIDIKDNDGVSARGCIDKIRPLASLLKFPLHICDVVDQEDERRKTLGSKVCTFCARGPEGQKALLVCSKCKKARYCAPPRGCQRGDWPRHKAECKSHK